ncbi:MAG: GAF domain-containing protein [Pseudomonadota bacterium]
MEFAEVLADPDQPGATFSALQRLVEDTIGVRLFTLMTLDHAAGTARRSYSNIPDAYPVSGEKPMEPNPWADHVLSQRKTFVANSIEAIAEVFPDHALIQSLGCESCINIPVLIADRVVGTINCLHQAGHYTPARVAQSESLKGPGAIAFMVAATHS